MPVPIALLVDDGSPVNPMFFHDPPYTHPLLIPNSLARDFADLCDEYGVRGKFSVLPMPCCLGASARRFSTAVSIRKLRDQIQA